MDQESADKILDWIQMTDEEFLETYMKDNSKEDQEALIKEFPELKEFFEKNR